MGAQPDLTDFSSHSFMITNFTLFRCCFGWFSFDFRTMLPRTGATVRLHWREQVALVFPFLLGPLLFFFVSFTDFVGGAGHHRSAAVGPPAVSRRPGCVGSRQMTLARHGWINHTTRRWFSVSCCCFLFWVSTGSPCVASAVRHSIEFYRVSPTVPHRPRISLFESRMRRGAGPN